MLRRSSLTAALLACAFGAFGCASAGETTRPAGAASSAKATKTAPATGFARFSRSWEVKLDSDVVKLVITKEAVVALGSVAIDVFARTDGRKRISARSGCAPLAADVDAAGRLTIVCASEIRSLQLDTLEHQSVKDFTSTAVAAAFSTDEIAVELMMYTPRPNASPAIPVELVVLDRATRAEKRRLPTLDGYALALAANPGGLLVGVFQNGVELNRAPSTTWRHLVKGGNPIFAVPSPSGRHVFFSGPSTGSMAIDVATAGVVRGWRGTTPNAAAWIRDEAVVIIGGKEGIRMLELTGQEVLSPHESTLTSLAVGDDGRALCAHSIQAGQLSCYFDR